MLINTCFSPCVLIVIIAPSITDLMTPGSWWWSHENDPWFYSDMPSSDVMENHMNVFDPLFLIREGSDIVLGISSGVGFPSLVDCASLLFRAGPEGGGINSLSTDRLANVSLRWGLGEECPLVGGVALGLLERDIRFRPSSSAEPVHVVLNMAFTPEDEPWIKLLMALTCLLRLNDALLVKESSRDLPEPIDDPNFLDNNNSGKK